MDDRDHQRSGSHARQRPIVGTAAAPEAMTAAIGGYRRHQDDVRLLNRENVAATVNAEFQITIGEHDRQQHPDPALTQRLQGCSDVRLTTER